MSPTEAQLRAALRHGEGDVPDVDAVIGASFVLRRQRHDRRVRLVAVAAAIVVVGGIGTGIGVLNSTNDSSAGPSSKSLGGRADQNSLGLPINGGSKYSSTEGGTGGTGGAANSVAGAGSVPSPAPLVPHAADATACPATQVRYSLPGGGGLSQFGSGGSLFAKPVTSLLICSYPLHGQPIARTEVGAAAKATAAAIENSTAASSPLACVQQSNLEVIPYSADGALTPLEVTGTCNQLMVTNGTAVRYVDNSVLSPATTTGRVPGKVSGSPSR